MCLNSCVIGLCIVTSLGKVVVLVVLIRKLIQTKMSFFKILPLCGHQSDHLETVCRMLEFFPVI